MDKKTGGTTVQYFFPHMLFIPPCSYPPPSASFSDKPILRQPNYCILVLGIVVPRLPAELTSSWILRCN